MDETGYNYLIGGFFSWSIALLAVITKVVFRSKYGWRSGFENYGSIFLFISMALFFLGDFLWFVLEVFFNIINPLGLTDIVWCGAYITLIIAMFFFVQSIFVESRALKVSLISLGFLAGIVNLIINLQNTYTLSLSNILIFITQVYPAFDFILLGLALALLAPLVTNHDKAFLGIYVLIMGILARLIFDNIYVILVTKHAYYTGHWIDLLYVLLYIAISIRIFLFAKEREGGL